MKHLVRISLAGLAGLMLVGSVEAMPIAAQPANAGAGIEKAAVIITKVVRRRRPMMMMMRRRPMMIKKTIIRR